MDQVTQERVNGKGKGPRGVVEPETTYAVEVEVVGTEAMLCHRYDTEAVKSKGAAKKGSKEKKTDNLESYVYRLDNGECGFPGLNFKAALCDAARYQQDPRSPRKSARDLFRAGIKCPGMASFGRKTWDYEDVRKCNVQRSAITRTRPAFKAGWQLKFRIDILLPEYVTEELLQSVVEQAGRVVGLGDFRPDFGTYRVVSFKRL
jgi:hypothetical protein